MSGAKEAGKPALKYFKITLECGHVVYAPISEPCDKCRRFAPATEIEEVEQ
jgi:hypothetical protein